jgi:subtilisin-like proprotein convertase family protein
MKRLFNSLLPKARRRNFLDKARKQLGIESLESRSLMAGIPALNSNPSAMAQLYLDFDGHFQSGTWGSYSNLNIPAFDQDGDSADYNAEEVAYIQDVWSIVAEDFAPFNINVTTVQPSVLAEGQSVSASNGIALRIAIGGDDAEVLGTSGIAGMAQYNSFTNSHPNLALTFPVSSPGNYMSVFSTGTTISHEAGHSFGLRHHPGNYNFNAQWAAIMNPGVFGFEDTWWAIAEDDLGNLQDDMAMLSNSTNGFGYRADDVGNTLATAATLVGSGTTFAGTGIIGSTSDVDIWKLTTSGTQSLKIKLDGALLSPNLDAVLELLDASGNVMLTAAPSDSYDAELIVEAVGTTYLSVKSTGAYGRVGGYTLSVEESAPGIKVNAKTTLNTSESTLSDQFSVSLASRPTADVIINLASSDVTEGDVSLNQLIFTPQNWYLPQTVSVNGMDDAQVDGVVNYSINFTSVASTDANYDGLNVAAINASNADNDVAGQAVQLGGLGNVYTVDMKVGPDGSLYVTGSFSQTIDFDPTSGVQNVTANYLSNSFVAKYTPTNELMWVRSFGDEGGGLIYGRGLAVDSAGNAYLAGYFTNTSVQLGSTTLTTQGSSDAFLTKLDPHGNFAWVKSWGSTSSDEALDLFLDGSGVLHVAGAYSATVDFNPGASTLTRTSAGGYDLFVSRFDLNGNFLSVATTGGAGTEYPRSIAVASTGEVFVSGHFTDTTQLGSSTFTSAGGADGFLLKLDSSGSIPWAKQAAGVPSGGTSYRLATTSLGDVYLAGAFSETLTFENDVTLTSAGGTDVFLVKYSSSGELLYTGQLSGIEAGTIGDIAVDSQNQIALVGEFIGTVDIDPGANEKFLTSLSSEAEFVLLLDHEANYLASHIMPRGVGAPRAITFDSKGNIYATGQFTTSIAMPTGEVLVNAEGDFDSYILRINTASGIRVSHTSGVVTTEGGDTANISVVLDLPPSADVTINLASSDLTEGTLSKSMLTFTPENWNVPQVVTIQGVNDLLLDGDQLYSIQFSPALSADPNYNALQTTAISAINVDDEFSTTTFARIDGRTIPDRGTLNSDLSISATGTISDLNVRVNIQHGWNEDLDVFLIAPDGTRVELFTDVGSSSSNFTNTQFDQNAATLITAGSAPFTGVFRPEGNLSVLNGKQLFGNWRLEVKDDAKWISGKLVDWSITATYFTPVAPAGVTVTPTFGLVTSENGATASFTVVLSSAPESNATISIVSSDTTEGTVSTSSLTFTAANWNVPQTVVVIGVNDSIVDGSIAYSIITGAIVSADPRYSGFAVPDVSVTNTDNDAAPPPTTVFEDSFEVGEWNGLWVEDSQNDWYRSNQRATQGSRSAEIDGSATNATLTTASSFNVTSFASVTLTYSWYIESSFDAGEYISLDVSTNGGSTWTLNVRQLRGNIDAENTWHHQTVDLTPYKSSNLQFRFRSSVSASDEDGNVDNVKIVGSNEGGASGGESGALSPSSVLAIDASSLQTEVHKNSSSALADSNEAAVATAWAHYDSEDMLSVILDRRSKNRKAIVKSALL